MKTFIILLLSLFTINQASAQEINIKNGEEFTILIRNSENVLKDHKLVNDHAFSFHFKKTGSNEAGTQLQCALIKAREWATGGYGIINTDSIKLLQFNSTSVLTPLIILQKPFTVTVSPKGKLVKVEGSDELVKQAITKWHLKADIASYLKENIDGFLATSLNGMFFELPEQKIAYQSTWTNAVGVTFNVTAIRGALLNITSNTADKTSTPVNYTLNEVNGLLESKNWESNQKPAPDARQFAYEQSIAYGKSTASAIDTAWLNMAITMSFMSDAFKNKKNDNDSAKVFAFIKQNDPIYNTDKYYILAKLSLINSMRGNNANEIYSDILLTVPNKLLEGQSSHLFNKMHPVMSTDIDQIYDVITYFHKETGSFRDWIQNSYAQDFLQEGKGRDLDNDDDWKDAMRKHGLSDKRIADMIAKNKISVKNSYLLIERLHKDKNPIIKRNTEGLYLWVNARENKANKAELIKTAKQFTKLKDDFMKTGNGGRYGLLIYSLLKDAGLKKEAETVMNKTVIDLEKYTADTLYRGRYATQNLLAHAYYLKYQNVKTTDTVQALAYLAKASQYSPIKANERAYDSFYDRVFLHSQESYRKQYINKLFEHGASVDALKTFADLVNADLGKMDEMKKIYQTRFPNKSFKDFVTNNVLTRWDTAPAFALKGIDGKDYKLADYKGKWLVTDFWGTWCGPCREEMPEVNKFNDELIAGKHTGIAFLSIATYDNVTSVSKYLTDNKFGITTAMGSDDLSKSYKVSGYPTKVIISPEGKMISTSYGADWRAVVKNLNALYTAN